MIENKLTPTKIFPITILELIVFDKFYVLPLQSICNFVEHILVLVMDM